MSRFEFDLRSIEWKIAQLMDLRVTSDEPFACDDELARLAILRAKLIREADYYEKTD